jgi:acylphosphatase
MAQCLRISFMCDLPKSFFNNSVQKQAKKLGLEGIVQMDDKNILIEVCGNKQSIEQFEDIIYEEISKKVTKNLERIPFIKEKDYRGVFRVIE